MHTCTRGKSNCTPMWQRKYMHKKRRKRERYRRQGGRQNHGNYHYNATEYSNLPHKTLSIKDALFNTASRVTSRADNLSSRQMHVKLSHLIKKHREVCGERERERERARREYQHTSGVWWAFLPSRGCSSYVCSGRN